MHTMISINPFFIWGVDFMDYEPMLASGHKIEIVFIDYFRKWEESMQRNKNMDTATTHIFFNHIKN